MIDHRSPQPVVRAVETEDGLIISVEMAGIPKDKINVSFDNRCLTITGTREETNDDKKYGDTYYKKEIQYGDFKRLVPIPEKFDENGIKASHRDGLLEITIPKKEKVSKKINIPLS